MTFNMYSTMRIIWFVVLVLGLLSNNLILADEYDHLYEDHDEVLLWMNTVGPYENSQEIYPYFSLPFCLGVKETFNSHHTLLDKLTSNELQPSGLDIEFNVPIPKTLYCVIDLKEESIKAFVNAVKNNYWYRMYIDNFPIMGVVGGEEMMYDGENITTHYYIWAHKKFNIGYNGGRIVDVNVTDDIAVELKSNRKIRFSYEINWRESDIKFEHRFDKYFNIRPGLEKFYWIGVFCSSWLIIYFVYVVAKILKLALGKDCVRHSGEEKMDDKQKESGDNSGCEQIHEVLRPPSYPMLFSAFIGAGHQAIVMTFVVLIYVIFGKLYTERGAISTTAIFTYVMTSPVNGFVGGRLYARFSGQRWIEQMTLSALMLPVMVYGIACPFNIVAIYYHASNAIWFNSSLIEAVGIGIITILPLTFGGAILGRNFAGTPDVVCNVNVETRPVPNKNWFMKRFWIILSCAMVPACMAMMLMNIFLISFWKYNIFYHYEYMLLEFIIVMILSVEVDIIGTYTLLTAEDYRWQWMSFLTGTSTGGLVFVHSVFHYFMTAKNIGLLQFSSYFGYIIPFCLVLGIMCGAVGYTGSNIFVTKIYSPTKK